MYILHAWNPVGIWTLYLWVCMSTWLQTRVYPHTNTSSDIYQQYLKSPTQILKESYTTPPTQYHPRSPILEETVSPRPLKLSPSPPPPLSREGGEGEGHAGNTFIGLLQYSKTRRTVYIYEHIWYMTWYINTHPEPCHLNLHASTQTHIPKCTMSRQTQEGETLLSTPPSWELQTPLFQQLQPSQTRTT